MDNDSVLEQIVNSLSFEVEAVPQDNVLQLTTTTKAAPLNVKIRVRKKEKAAFRNGVISLPNKPNQPDNVPERFRLVSSDHTIMSFSVVMEADFQKPAKKSRGILGIFKPTNCLGSQPDDEDYTYLPSTTYQAKVNDGNSKSDGALTKFTLMKNEDRDEKSATSKSKNLFRRCKPGGCLDPPFGEDRLPYSPAIVDEKSTAEMVTKSQRRTSSVLSNKIFHKKKKSHDVATLDNEVISKVPKDASVTDLYHSESHEPYSTNSIMTYPPTLSSREIHEEKRGSRIRTNSSKNSFNEHSGSFFMIPKKQKYAIDKNDTVNKENDSNTSDSKLPETLNKKPRESGALIIENLVTQQHLTKFSDSNNLKDLTPLNSPVLDNSNDIIFIPIPVTTQIEQVEKNKRRKESQEKRFLVTRRRNSISSNLLKMHKNGDDKLDSLLQSDNIVSSKNIPKNEIPTTEQIVIENKPANKSVVSIEAKHELSDMDLTSPTLKMERKSSSKTFTDTPIPIKDKPSETINHEYDNLQHLWQNMNDPMISDIKFQKEDELVNQSDTKNETKYEVDGKVISEKTSNISLSNLDNNIKDLVKKENDNIKPHEIVTTINLNPSNKDYALKESVKQNDDVIDSTADKNDSDDEQGTSNIIQLKDAADDNKDILGLIQQERKFELATEPSPRTISSSNSDIKSKEKSIIDIDEFKKPLTFENNEIIKNNLPSFDDKTLVFFKGEEGVLESKNSSKTNSENDLLPYAQEDNTELNKYDNRNIKSFLLDDLTRQDDKENCEPDPSKYIIEEKSILEKDRYFTDDRIKSVIDEELSDYLNNPFNNQNENITKFMKYDGIPSVPDAVSYAIDNKLDNSSKKNSENDLLLYALKDNSEYNEYDGRNNNTYELDDLTEDKTVTSQYVEENGKQDPSKNITEDKPEFETAGQASSERNSYSYIAGDRIKSIKDEELSDFLNNPFNYQNESKTELIKYDEVFSVQDTIKFTSESELDQRENLINHNQDLLNEIIESQIESSKLSLSSSAVLNPLQGIGLPDKPYEPINEPEHLYITDKMQDSTLKDSALHESINKAKSLSSVDDSEISKFTDQNKINSDTRLKFDHEIKTDSKTTTYAEQAGFKNGLSDKHNLSIPFETIPTNKARPIFVDFAVQSYVDKNQTIVKSLNTDNVPKRYPQDSIKVTKLYLNTDEEIQIPIDLDNNLYIQIKSNKLRDNMVNNNTYNIDQGVTEKLLLNKHKPYLNELDPIKRNGIIAEDIRKTLEVVYEKELLPLRSHISELNENIKMLTAHHTSVTGRMFVTKKSRSTKLIPIFKKCSCTRR